MNTEESLRAIWASADEPCIEAMTYKDGSSFARNFEIESVISDFTSQACESDNSDDGNNDQNSGFVAIPQEFRPSKRRLLKVKKKSEVVRDLENMEAKSNLAPIHHTDINHNSKNSKVEGRLLIEESSFFASETEKANLYREENNFCRDTSKNEKEFDHGDFSSYSPSHVHKKYEESYHPAFQGVSPKSERCEKKIYHENVKHLASKFSEFHFPSGIISDVNQNGKETTQPFTPNQFKFQPYISNNNSKEIPPKPITKLLNFSKDLVTGKDNIKGLPDKFSKLSFELDGAFDAGQNAREFSNLQAPEQSKSRPYILNNKTTEFSPECKITKLPSFPNNHVNRKYVPVQKNYNSTKITTATVIEREIRHNVVWKSNLCTKKTPKANRISYNTSSTETYIKHVAQNKNKIPLKHVYSCSQNESNDHVQDKITKAKSGTKNMNSTNSINFIHTSQKQKNSFPTRSTSSKESTSCKTSYRDNDPMRPVSNKIYNYSLPRDKTDAQRAKDMQRNKLKSSNNHQLCHRVIKHENKFDRKPESIPIVIKHEVKVIHLNELSHEERNFQKEVYKELSHSIKTNRANNAFESNQTSLFAGMRKREIIPNILLASDDNPNYIKDTTQDQKESMQKYEKNLNKNGRRNIKSNLQDLDSDECSYHSASEETGEDSNEAAKESAARKSDIYENLCNNVNTCSGKDESKALLVEYAKDIIDLSIGSQTAADLFISYYDEWVSTRTETILMFEQLLRSIQNVSKKGSKFQEIVKVAGVTGNIVSTIPHVYVSMAGKIISVLSSLISKICGSSSSLQSLDIDEFSIMRCLQQDIDVTSTFYMHGLQCNEQFEETRKLFETFHQNIIEGKYPCAAESPELSDFFNEITEFNPNHRYYFRRLQKSFEKLSGKNTSAPIKVFCEAFADCPKAIAIIGKLDWSFNAEGFENNYLNNIFEKISDPLQKDSSTLSDLLKELHNCILELTRSRRSVKEVISRLIVSRDG